MPLHEKLRLHLADKEASWRDGVVAWTEAGERHLLVPVEGGLTAAAVVDAHLAALREGARARVAYEGGATSVARGAAERFGVALIDASALVLPAEAPAPVEEPAPVVELHATFLPPPEPELLPAPEPALLLPAAFPAVAEAAIPAPPDFPAPGDGFFDALDMALVREALAEPEAAPEVPLLEPAPEEIEADLVAVAQAIDDALAAMVAETPVEAPVEAAAPEVVAPAAPEPAVEVAVEPASVVVPVALPEPAVADGPALPWDPAAPAEAPLAEAAVTPDELAALPWNALPEEHHELLPAGRARGVDHHPTTLLPPAPGWGLPWPRPTPPADGLAIADPSIWRAQERIAAVREDLDRAGGGSFGAVKPDGSAWLKRIQTY